MKKNSRISEVNRVPLCEAVIDGDLDRFKLLVDAGADINEKDYNGITALWYATQNGEYEMARILIDKGADIEIRNAYGNTPLSNAVYYYRRNEHGGDMIKLLIDAGADINAENDYGVSPLSLARCIAGFPYLDILAFDSKST